MTRINHVRVGMSALAAIMIVGLALSAAPTPVYAGCNLPALTCVDLQCRLNACNSQPDPAACKATELTTYAALAAVCFGSSCSDDGRMNTNCSAPEIVYCDEDTIDFWLYNYFTSEGDFDFSIPTADLMQSVSVKTLIVQNGQVKVYLMPDGTVLLLAPQSDGKIYYMEFNPLVCVSTREGAEWGLK